MTDKILDLVIDFGFAVKELIHPPKSHEKIAEEALQRANKAFPSIAAQNGSTYDLTQD